MLNTKEGRGPKPPAAGTPEGRAWSLLRLYRDSARQSLKTFLAEVERDPFRALKLSDGAFEAAAMVQVTAELLAALDGGTDGGKLTVVQLVERSRKNALVGARDPQMSFRVTRTFAAQCLTSVWATMAMDLPGLLKEV